MGYFKYPSSKFITTGLRYEIKNPCKDCDELTLRFEESYERIWEEENIPEDNTLEYLKTGLGVDLNFGKKFYYVIGGGLTTKISLRTSNYYGDDVRKIVLGGKFNTGLGYIVSNRLLVSLLGQYHWDITASTIDETLISHPPLSTTNIEYIKGRYIFIQLNLSYLIKK
ncbi:MAG: hypothetical protein GY760_29375 [Deltaproteobacteria bacterium]|nr:hypothetical protein [Deltaproteobacteria bacterium]